MLTTEDFIEAGYRRFSNPGTNNPEFGLQKLISDECGKRYYITVLAYDWKKYPQFNHSHKMTFEPDVQLKLRNDVYFNVQMLLNPDSTIQDIESFCNEMWEKFNCQYYERYND